MEIRLGLVVHGHLVRTEIALSMYEDKLLLLALRNAKNSSKQSRSFLSDSKLAKLTSIHFLNILTILLVR